MSEFPQRDEPSPPAHNHLSVGVLGTELSGPDRAPVRQLLDHEPAHGDRPVPRPVPRAPFVCPGIPA